MSVDWRKAVCQPALPARINDVHKYVTEASTIDESPVDAFYRTSQEILRAATLQFITNHPAVAGLFLVGLVSATENYFRDVLSRVVTLCPVAQEAAASQQIALSSVIWHGGDNAPERGALELKSLASAENLRKAFKDFAKLDGKWIEKAKTLNGAIDEFDKVCEFRHNLVHSGAVLAGRNAVALQIRGPGRAMMVAPGYAEIQEVADVCTNLVISANTELFAVLAERWAGDWRKKPNWDPGAEHALFKEIWALFRSQRDDANNTIPERVSLIRARNAIRAEFS